MVRRGALHSEKRSSGIVRELEREPGYDTKSVLPSDQTRGRNVPVISAFFGIVIRMFYREHGVAHFHAEFQAQQATFTFDGEILAAKSDRAQRES
jgi:hypothetical protein